MSVWVKGHEESLRRSGYYWENDNLVEVVCREGTYTFLSFPKGSPGANLRILIRGNPDDEQTPKRRRKPTSPKGRQRTR